MEKIEFNPGASIESCFAQLRLEAQQRKVIVCGDFNGTMMRSDESLRCFYQKYYNEYKPNEECANEPSDLIRRFAKQYSQSIPQFEHNRLYSEDDFCAGMGFWAEIQRDNDGFAKDDCLDEMFANMPFLIYDRRDNDIEAVCCDDWRGDIDKHPYYTHWKPIPLPLKPKDIKL